MKTKCFIQLVKERIVPILVFAGIFIYIAILMAYENKINTSLANYHSSGNYNSSDTKTILLLLPYADDFKQWDIIFERILSGRCPNSRCIFVSNPKYLAQVDAVILGGMQLNGNFGNFTTNLMTKRRKLVNKSILWIFMSYESPETLRDVFHVNLRNYDRFFNWTMTYRMDSDVISTYGELFPRSLQKAEKEIELELNLQDKNTDVLATCMVSHCTTSSKREDLIAELQRFIPIDVYGKCGTKSCGSPRYIGKIDKHSKDPCDDVIQKYYFYLAFENSLCKDYVTEKFYRALKLGVVPVVLGGANYTAIAPPHSFINVDDFSSVAALADHLKKVANDRQLYQNYLEWQKNYTVEVYHPYDPQVCGLCAKLHSRSLQSKTYKSLFDWFDAESKCFSWTKR